MFSAIMKGKSGVKEDVITSSVFDNLLYLPDDLFWKILRLSCYNNFELPLYAGDISKYEFWPHWNNKDTENEKYVEPNFYVKFENFDIIVEAKRENNFQEREQWEKEIISYLNEYGDSNRTVFLIALDGMANEESEIIEIRNRSIKIFKSRRLKVLDTCNRLYKEIISNSFVDINHRERLIGTIINYLKFYGFL
jgi:hypothetical protein